MTSSLPGKASRRLETLFFHPICDLEAEPGKLDIKIREHGILFISVRISSLFKMAIMT